MARQADLRGEAFRQASVHIGVGELHLPARSQFTGNFGFYAPHHRAVGGDVSVVAIRRQTVAIQHGVVVLACAEQSQRAIQAAVQECRLQADLVSIALDGREHAARRGLRLLRLEDAGVAGVCGDGAGQVVNHARVGGVDALLPHVVRIGRPIGVVVRRLLIPPRYAGSQHQRQRIGRTQTHRAIDRRLLLGVVTLAGRLPVRFGHVAVPLTDIGNLGVITRRDPERIHVIVAPGARGACAHHQIMLAAEGIECAGQAGVDGVLGFRNGPFGHPHRRAPTRRRVGPTVAAEPAIGAIIVIPRAGQGHRTLPQRRELMVQRGEHVVARAFLAAPVGRRVESLRKIRPGAIRVRGRKAEVRARGASLALILRAQGQQRAFGQISLDHSVKQLRILLDAINERTALLPRANQPAAQLARFVQRAAQIEFRALVVPGTHGRPHAGLELAGGPLAHQIDRRRGVAGAVQQTGGAAHHFDPVVQRCVQPQRIEVLVRGHAVHLHVGDFHAARIQALFVVVGRSLFLENQAWRIGNGVFQRIEPLIRQALARHHRYRLRRLAQRHRQLGGSGGQAHGVRAGTFTGRGLSRAQHFHGRQRLRAGDAQAIVVAALADGFQSRTRQHRRQARGDAVIALQTRALLALRQLGVERQNHTRLGRKAAEGQAQRTGRDVVSVDHVGRRRGLRQRGRSRRKPHQCDKDGACDRRQRTGVAMDGRGERHKLRFSVNQIRRNPC
ncbi:hypothetical protein D3C71_1097460 [compost metagenome]